MCEEIWKKIENFSSYKISNFGNVKNHILDKNVKPQLKNSYYSVCITNDNNIRMGKLIHRLVAETFIDNVENKKTVNHIDKNTLNNNVTNLEWATMKEQNIHKNLHKIKTNFSLISSRPVCRIDLKDNSVIENYDSLTLACKWIFDNNISVQTKYDNDFMKAKKTLKSKLCTAIKLHKKIFENNWQYSEMEKFENEIWKIIPKEYVNDVDGCQVSTCGRVKNKYGRISCGAKHTNGYTKVRLYSKTYAIHRLVAQVFIHNPNKREQVNHIDGNKQNNIVDNLEWTTAQENSFLRSNCLLDKTRKIGNTIRSKYG